MWVSALFYIIVGFWLLVGQNKQFEHAKGIFKISDILQTKKICIKELTD